MPDIYKAQLSGGRMVRRKSAAHPWMGTPLYELWLKDADGNLIELYARLTEEEITQRPADAQAVWRA